MVVIIFTLLCSAGLSFAAFKLADGRLVPGIESVACFIGAIAMLGLAVWCVLPCTRPITLRSDGSALFAPNTLLVRVLMTTLVLDAYLAASGFFVAWAQDRNTPADPDASFDIMLLADVKHEVRIPAVAIGMDPRRLRAAFEHYRVHPQERTSILTSAGAARFSTGSTTPTPESTWYWRRQ